MELWKQVPKTNYSISNAGAVRNDNSGHILKPGKNRNGYLLTPINLRKQNKKHSVVHRWVAELFIGPGPEGYQVNHKNGIKDDNRVGNLEWVTGKENLKHSLANELHTYILTPKKAKLICTMYNCGYTVKEISDLFKVYSRTVEAVCAGRSWGSVTWQPRKNIGKPKGENHRDAKLTEEKVIRLRNLLLENNMSNRELGDMFGVSRGTVQKIKREGSWKGIGPSTKHLINEGAK